MADVTLTDFYTRVLRELKVVPPNGTANAEDRQRVVDMYPNIHDMLLEKNLIDFGVADSIPSRFAIPVIRIIAYQLANEFSVSEMSLMKLKAEGELDAYPIAKSERQLRKLMQRPYVESVVSNQYF